MPSAVEVIRQFHSTRSFGTRENLIASEEAVGKAYRQLGESEVAELVGLSLSDEEHADSYLPAIACLRPGSLKPHHERLLDHRVIYPGIIYHEADNAIAERMAKLLDESSNTLRLNHLLLCIAWAGNSVVQERFAEWRRVPPSWGRELHVPPHSYANEAGWELEDDGSRRDLYFETALPLVPKGSADSFDSEVIVGEQSEDCCPWCKRQLVTLLRMDLTSSRLAFLRANTITLEIPTCDACTAFGVIHTSYRDGSYTWHPATQRPDYLPDDAAEWDAFPDEPLVLGDGDRHYMESASWTGTPGVRFSQLGGLPTWVQDAEYPDCLDCSKKMRFVGQIDNEDLDPIGEGILYAFYCEECRTTATHYQQS